MKLKLGPRKGRDTHLMRDPLMKEFGEKRSGKRRGRWNPCKKATSCLGYWAVLREGQRNPLLALTGAAQKHQESYH